MDDPTLPAWDHSEDDERLAAIQDVVEHAKRITRAVALAKPMESYRSRPIVLTALALAFLALSLYSVITRPAWVYGPDPAQVPRDMREGHLRFAMFLVAQRLNDYRDSTRGQLPQSLGDVGEDWPIIYRNTGAGVYELRSIDASVPAITYRSDQDVRKLLGQGRSFLRDRAP